MFRLSRRPRPRRPSQLEFDRLDERISLSGLASGAITSAARPLVINVANRRLEGVSVKGPILQPSEVDLTLSRPTGHHPTRSISLFGRRNFTLVLHTPHGTVVDQIRLHEPIKVVYDTTQVGPFLHFIEPVLE
jgi:hypothetical protein